MDVVHTEVGVDVSLAVFDKGTIRIERLELPGRATGEIDVAISAAAICGSDLHTVLGHREAPARTVLGHEGVGHVADLDDEAVDLRGMPLQRGDRVVFSMLRACGVCDRCSSGLTMKCRSLLKYGHESATTPPHATGTLASRVRLVPGVPLLRVPDELGETQVVSAGCAVATAAAVVAAIGSRAATGRVLVFGAGAVGAYAAAMLASLGYTVSVRDPARDRLALVESFGASPDGGGGMPFPVVVEASGNARAFAGALGAADVGGLVVAAGSVSPGSSTVELDPADLVTRRLTVTGVHNYTTEDFRRGVDWLVAHGRNLGLERMVSPPIPLSEVHEAFQLMREGSYPRVLVRPDVAEGAM
jgi:threonine 3-dehydrogenase